MKRIACLISFCFVLVCMQQNALEFPIAEILNFKSLSAQIAYSFYNIQQQPSLEQRLTELSALDLYVQGQSPRLADQLYKQALCLLKSVYCGDMSSIDDLWYAHIKDDTFHIKDEVNDKPIFSKLQQSITIANHAIMQKNIYTPLPETQKNIENAYQLVDSLWKDIKNYKDISIDSNQLTLLSFYGSISIECLRHIDYIINCAILNFHKNVYFPIGQEDDYFNNFFNSHPLFKNLYHVVRTQSIRFQRFLWLDDDQKADDFIAATQQMLDMINNSVFLGLSKTLQRALALELYCSRIPVPDYLFQNNKAFECYNNISNYYQQEKPSTTMYQILIDEFRDTTYSPSCITSFDVNQ